MKNLYAVNRNGGYPGLLGQLFLFLRGLKPVTLFGVHEAMHLHDAVNGDTLEGVESAEQIRAFGMRMATAGLKAAGVHIVVEEEANMMVQDAHQGIDAAHDEHNEVAQEQGAEISKLQSKINEHQGIINKSASSRDAAIRGHEETKNTANTAAHFFTTGMLPAGSQHPQVTQ